MKKQVISLISFFLLLLTIINTSSLSASAASNDVLGLENGAEYYIKRTASDKYLDVYNGSAQNGQNVLEYGFHGDPNQRWRISRLSDGRYQLATGLNNSFVLDVTGNNVDIYKNSSLDCQKFQLIRTGHGTYNIMSGSKYVTSNGSGNVILSSSYPSGTWSFEKRDKGDADIYSFKYENGKIFEIFPTNYDSTGANDTFKNQSSNMGYSPFVFTNVAASSALNYLKNDNIFVHNGHGSEGSMAFYNSSTNSGTWSRITIANINSLSEEGTLEMVFFVCDEENLEGKTIEIPIKEVI